MGLSAALVQLDLAFSDSVADVFEHALAGVPFAVGSQPFLLKPPCPLEVFISSPSSTSIGVSSSFNAPSETSSRGGAVKFDELEAGVIFGEWHGESTCIRLDATPEATAAAVAIPPGCKAPGVEEEALVAAGTEVQSDCGEAILKSWPGGTKGAVLALAPAGTVSVGFEFEGSRPVAKSIVY